LTGEYFCLSISLGLLSFSLINVLTGRIIMGGFAKGQSPFRADNQHSHNMLNGHFSRRVKSKNMANSLTGVTIAVFSVTPGALILLQESQRNELLCFTVFGVQCCLFGLVHIASNVSKQSPQSAVDG
jgi:hypothetical protein